MLAVAASGPSPLWFMTRGTGAVSLVLLTVTVALGIANVRRTQIGQLPRFVTDAVHRSASLLAVSFLFVHVATALLDGFAPITLLDVVIPFGSAYRPLWLGFGAVALDLTVALIITSLLRRRLGYRSWRMTHWLAYASWPVALLHGLGTGSDTRTHWMLLLSAGCVVVMVVAVLARVSSGWPDRIELRLSALGATAAVALGLLVWLPSGPLARGWAQRAGTPSTLLPASAASSSPASSAAGVPIGRPVVTSGPAGGERAENETSFSTSVQGTVQQSAASGGQKVVDLSLRAPDRRLSVLRIRIRGQSLGASGVQMTSSRVTLGPVGDASQYVGAVTALNGSDIQARVDNPGYAAFDLLIRLQLSAGGSAAGTVIATAHEGAH